MQAVRSHEDVTAVVSALGLAIRSEFVPFSRSRNAKEKQPSLNWRVTVTKDGRDVLTTDYMAGCAHCPAYKDPKHGRPGFMSIDRDNAVRRECETGKTFRNLENFGFAATGKHIEPATLDVLYSLVSGSDAIDCATFEEWASNRACLEIALKLRAAVGDSGLTQLREAFQGY